VKLLTSLTLKLLKEVKEVKEVKEEALGKLKAAIKKKSLKASSLNSRTLE